MATSWESVNVQCPFYRESNSRNLRCEGIWSGSSLTTTFTSPNRRLEYMEKLCMGCYTRCPLYGQIERKYEE